MVLPGATTTANSGNSLLLLIYEDAPHFMIHSQKNVDPLPFPLPTSAPDSRTDTVGKAHQAVATFPAMVQSSPERRRSTGVAPRHPARALHRLSPGRSPWAADRLQAETFPDRPGKQSDGEITLHWDQPRPRADQGASRPPWARGHWSSAGGGSDGPHSAGLRGRRWTSQAGPGRAGGDRLP